MANKKNPDIAAKFAKLKKPSSGKQMATDPNVAINQQAKKREKERAKASENVGGWKRRVEAPRLNAIRDLSDKQADRLVGAIEKEERAIAEVLTELDKRGEKDAVRLVDFYREKLQTIYYSSFKDSDAFFGGNKPLEKEYLPKVNFYINAIKKDEILIAAKETVIGVGTFKKVDAITPLLALAEKIKLKLIERSSLSGKLKATASGLFGSDIGASILAGAATKSPFVALAVYAFKNRSTAKNQRIREAEADEAQKELERERAGPTAEESKPSPLQNAMSSLVDDEDSLLPETDEPSAPESAPEDDKQLTLPGMDTPEEPEDDKQLTPPGMDTPEEPEGEEQLALPGMDAPPTAPSAPAPTPAPEAAPESPTATPESSKKDDELGGVGGQIVSILKQHTGLLKTIAGTSTKQLKMQEDYYAKLLADAEEGRLETGDSKPTATKAGDGDGDDKDDKKGGGLFGMLGNMIMRQLMGKLGPVISLITRAGGFLAGGLRAGAGLLSGARRAGAGLIRGGVSLARSGISAGMTAARGVATAGATKVASFAQSGMAAARANVATKVGAISNFVRGGAGGAAKAAAAKGAAAGAAKSAAKGGIKAFVRKFVPKAIAKLAAKSIPFLGAAVAGGFALWKLAQGDKTGAALEAASGIPVAGIAASIVSLARDAYKGYFGIAPEADPQVGEKFDEMKGEVSAVATEKLEELAGKGKDENEKKQKEGDNQDEANKQLAEQIDQQQQKTATPAPTPVAPPAGAPGAPSPNQPGATPPAGAPGAPSPQQTGATPPPEAPPPPQKKESLFNRLKKYAVRAAGLTLPGMLINAGRRFIAGDPRGKIETKDLPTDRPANVQVGSKADISKVDKNLLKRFYGFAKELGQPISINSAYRGDEYQAQLWVRGNIFKERGIYTPARPEKTTSITYQGQEFTVPGSGKGSAHGKGNALDVTVAGMGPTAGPVDQLMKKYGLRRPHLPKDPPHVQLLAGAGGQATDTATPAESNKDAAAAAMAVNNPAGSTATSAPVGGEGGGNAETPAGAPPAATSGAPPAATPAATPGATPAAPPAPQQPVAAASPTGADMGTPARAAITSGLGYQTPPAGGGGGGQPIIMPVQGGNTVMGGGGGGGATQIIPAPIDREPTIRRILDGSLT